MSDYPTIRPCNHMSPWVPTLHGQAWVFTCTTCGGQWKWKPLQAEDREEAEAWLRGHKAGRTHDQ